MSGVRIRFLPAASREAEDAFDWYRERSRRAAASFLKELDRGLILVVETPRVWPLFEAGTRRYVLQKFPYSIIYREIEDGIEVVAVAHQKRRPGYWHGR